MYLIAQVVLMKPDLTGVLNAIDLSQRTVHRIIWNFRYDNQNQFKYILNFKSQSKNLINLY